jgi:predicted transcriptional regulator
MKEAPFSFRIDKKLKTRLEKEAKRSKTTATRVVEAAITSYLDGMDGFRKELDKAFAEAEKGVFISGEAVHAWMQSWGTDKELPFPEPDIFPAGRGATSKKRKKAA